MSCPHERFEGKVHVWRRVSGDVLGIELTVTCADCGVHLRPDPATVSRTDDGRTLTVTAEPEPPPAP